jgi:NADH-quinone oxidoreductase subunit E
MVYRKSDLERVDLKSTEGNNKKSSVLNRAEDLLRGMDLLSEYYSRGLDDPYISFELNALVADAIERFPDDRQQALRGLAQELHQVDEIIDRYHGDKEGLIQILLDINNLYRWLPKSALIWISVRLKVPLTQIYHISSFYKAFSLVPQGRHLIQVCLGTACHVRGGERIIDRVRTVLGVLEGETTRDLKFTLEPVNCLGCCSLGPVMVVDGQYFGKMELDMVSEVLNKFE